MNYAEKRYSITSPDTVSIPIPNGTTYPFPLIPSGQTVTHSYAGYPGNYVISATAYIGTSASSTVGLSLDPAFGPAASNGNPTGLNTTNITGNDTGYGVAIDTNSKIAGNSNQQFGKVYVADGAGSNFAVTRYNANGTLDASGFNGGSAPLGTAYAGLTGTAFAVAVDSMGRILVAGTSGGKFALARFLQTGALDSSFGSSGTVLISFTGGNAQANALAIQQTDGKIVLAGSAANGTLFAAARFDPSTNLLDPNFGSGGTKTVSLSGTIGASAQALVLQMVGSNLDIVLGGYATYCSGCSSDFALTRLPPNGSSVDSTFGTNGYVRTNLHALACGGCGQNSIDSEYALLLQTDNKLVAAGYTNFPGKKDFEVVRYTANGALDSSFNSHGYAYSSFGGSGTDIAYGAALQADGKIVLAGTTSYSPGGTSNEFALARYNANGTLDHSFGTNGLLTSDINNGSIDTAYGVVVQTDGRIVAAGSESASGVTNVAIARYQPDNSVLIGNVAFAMGPDLGGSDDPPGDIATGGDGGNPAALGFSGAVRYADGSVTVGSTDLDPAEAGLISGHTRTWTDAPGVVTNSVNGNNVVVSQWPSVVQEKSGTLMAVTGGRTVRWFDSNGSSYIERFYGQDTLAPDGSGGYYLTDSAGNRFDFFGFANTINPLQQGQLQTLTDPGGNVTQFTYGGNGQLQTVQRIRHSDNVVLEQLSYTYNATTGQLTNVQMSRNGSAVRSLSFEYYDGTTSFGRAGDLARVTVTEGTTAVDHKLYVYDPTTGLLLYVVEGASYEKLALATPGGNPLNNSSAPLAQYADYAFTYYGPADGAKNGKVKTQKLNGGTYTYTYDYLADTGAMGLNTYRYKTLETLPDGNTNTIYTNYAGEVILKVFNDVSDPGNPSLAGKQWATAYNYDAAGRVTLEAEPSGVTTTVAAGQPIVLTDVTVTPSVTWYLNATGLEHLTDYYTTSPIGYEHDTYLRQGYSGNGVFQNTKTYTSRTAGGITVYPLASDTVYRGADGSGLETTSYAYTWQGTTVRAQTETITYPTVTANSAGFPSPSGENGDGTQDTQTIYLDAFGRVMWSKDPDGFIRYIAHDDATGAVTETIDDVNMTDPRTPSNSTNWTTPAGGGLELITLSTVDGLGRPTSVVNANNQTTTTQYIDNASVSEVITRLPTVSTGFQPPVQVTRDDRANGDVYTLTVVAGGTQIVSLSRSHYDATGQLAWSERYPDTSSVTYTLPATGQSATYGTLPVVTAAGYCTVYGYDSDGRQNRVATDIATSTSPPNLTTPQITRTVYDSLGRVASTWTGTADSDWVSPSQPGSNMTQITADQYDGGGVGDGNLTQMIEYPGSGQPNRVNQSLYDWRDRRAAEKDGVLLNSDGSLNLSGEIGSGVHRPIKFWLMDNLDEVIGTYQYDGDGVNLTDFASAANSATAPTVDSADLRALATDSYDERGRLYRSSVYSVDQSSGVVGQYPLVTNTFYDRRGDVMAVFAPGGLVTKSTYDGAGRLAFQYTTDGGAVNNGGTPPLDWTHASGVANDAVLTQTQTQYDNDSDPKFVITYQRHHDYTGYAALGYGNARISFVGNYYDEADRLIQSVNFGNNGDDGQSFLSNGNYMRPSTAPSRTNSPNGFDPALRTDYQYDAAGRQAIVTDPRGIQTRTYYDALGRTVTVTDAYTGSLSNLTPTGDPGPTSHDDQNRQTFYTYNGADEVRTQTATTYNPSAPNSPNSQTNTYTYGIVKNTSNAINSNTLLSQVSFGIVADPSGSNLPPVVGLSADTQQVSGYDALGEITQQINRDGTTHALTYDALGRQTDDHSTSTAGFSTGLISAWADEKKVSYDALGRAVELTMLSGGTAKNDVYDVYDGLGNLIDQYQPHDGSALSGGSLRSGIPVVQYTFDTNFTNNYSRQTQVIYPDSRVISYSYGFDTYPLGGTSTGTFLANLNTAISRIGYVFDGATAGPSVELEDYDYLGLNTVVTRDHPNSKGSIRESEIANNYYNNSGATGAKIASPPGTDPNGHSYPGKDDAGPQDPYDGLDRFGRVVDPGWSVSDRSIGYDADGNVLFTSILDSSIYENWKSEVYTYDNLNRQRSYQRGIMIGGTTFSSAYQSVSQTNVNIINSGGVQEPVNAAYLATDSWGAASSNGGNFTQTPPANPNSTLPLANVYQRPLPLPLASPPNATEYTLGSQNTQNERDMFVQFDAWGHLAIQTEAYLFADTSTGKYYFGGAYQNAYQFDALGRRISETTTDHNGSVTVTDLFYDGPNVIQENQSPGFSTSPVQTQCVWSPVAAGQMILRDDNDGSGVPNGTGNYGVPASALDRRVWPTQGPDGSTWTVQKQYTGSDNLLYHEEFIYNPSGQATSIDYDPATQQYDFFTTSEFDFRYEWKGGRAGRDVATNNTNQPTNPNTYVPQFNGTYLMPDGSVYESATGTQAPMNTDKYAFFRTTTANNGLNQYQYGTRSWVNVVGGNNGTGSGTQYLTKLDSDLEALGASFNAALTFGISFVSNVGSEVGGIFSGIANTVAHPITTYNNIVNQTASVIARAMQAGAGDTVSSLAGGAYLIGNVSGLTGLAEGIYGEDFATGQQLTGEHRLVRGLQGVSNLAFAAAGALKLASQLRLPSAGAAAVAEAASAEATQAGEAAAAASPRSIPLDLAPESQGMHYVSQEFLQSIGEPTCFVAGTDVVTGVDRRHHHFSEKPIEDVHVGDYVLTRDHHDPHGPLQRRRVLHTYVHTAYLLEDVSIRDRNGDVETIRTTPQHPFWVDGVGWLGAASLRPVCGSTSRMAHGSR